MLLNKDGGIIDDLMVARMTGRHEAEFAFSVVFNATTQGNRQRAREGAYSPPGVQLYMARNRALLALQGPKAEAVMARHCPDVVKLAFMGVAKAEFDLIEVGVTRSGYTGEDGFELSVRKSEAEKLARALLKEPEVLPIGLGARDSLRLEAGLCLYGHDIDETTSPVEADLAWAVAKRRREEKNFPGAARIMAELSNGPKRKRVGLRPVDKAPAREGAEITADGNAVGAITSGGFGPSINAPIAMGYVETRYANDGTEVALMVRGLPRPARVTPMPFVVHHYKRTVGKR